MKAAVVPELFEFLRIKGSWKLFLAMLAYGCGQGILRPMNAIYLNEQVHLDKLEISLVVAISLFTDMIVTFTSGWLSDHVRNKRILPIIAAAICCLGLWWYREAAGFWSALFGMIVATCPAGVIMGQIFAMARAHFSHEAPKIVEMAIVWLRAIMSVGFFAGLWAGAALFTAVSFRGILIGNIVCYVIVLLALLIYRERRAPAIVDQRQVVPFSLLTLIGLLLLLCGDAIRGLYFPLVVNSLYHSPALVSHLWSVQAIFELLWMTVAGYAAARFGTLRVIRLAAICGCVVYAVYALVPPIFMLTLMQPIHSLYVSTLYSVGMAYVQRMFLRRTGFGSSLYLFLTQTASFIGYFAPNLFPGYSPHIFFIPIGCVLLASLLLWQQVRRTEANSTVVTAGQS